MMHDQIVFGASCVCAGGGTFEVKIVASMHVLPTRGPGGGD